MESVKFPVYKYICFNLHYMLTDHKFLWLLIIDTFS
jgi:hypothetical protein